MESGFPWRKWVQLADRFLGEDFWSDLEKEVPDSVPKVDVYHTRSEVIVLVDLPGMEDLSRLQLRTDGQHLMIKGNIPSAMIGWMCPWRNVPRGSFTAPFPWGHG